VTAGEPTETDVALAGAGLLVIAAWVVLGFVNRDGDVRLVLSVALLALGAVLFVRLRRNARDRTWIGSLVFVLCGVAGLADRAGAGPVGALLGWLTFGLGIALLLRWRPPRAS
jgi:hypothetical protein